MKNKTRSALVFVFAILLLGIFYVYFFVPAWWHHGVMGAAHMTGMQGRMHEMMRSGAGHDNRSRVRGMMGELVPIGIKPELLVDTNSRGALILKKYCAQCHNLPSPKMHTSLEWPAVVSRMKQRMTMHSQMMGGIVVPTTQELTSLVDYLKKNAIKPFDTSRGTDLGTPSGQAFSSTCSACHGLPDPSQHTAKAWPEIVTRMQANMAIMGKTTPSGETREMLTKYLQRHAVDK